MPAHTTDDGDKAMRAMGWLVPPARGEPAPEEAGLMRLAAFRREHPEIPIRCGDYGVWYATLSLGDNSEQHVAEHRLGDLLDHLDLHVASPP